MYINTLNPKIVTQVHYMYILVYYSYLFQTFIQFWFCTTSYYQSMMGSAQITLGTVIAFKFIIGNYVYQTPVFIN